MKTSQRRHGKRPLSAYSPGVLASASLASTSADQIRILRMAPGDTLLAMTADHLSADQVRRCEAKLRALAPAGCNVGIVDGGTQLAVINRAQEQPDAVAASLDDIVELLTGFRDISLPQFQKLINATACESPFSVGARHLSKPA